MNTSHDVSKTRPTPVRVFRWFAEKLLRVSRLSAPKMTTVCSARSLANAYSYRWLNEFCRTWRFESARTSSKVDSKCAFVGWMGLVPGPLPCLVFEGARFFRFANSSPEKMCARRKLRFPQNAIGDWESRVSRRRNWRFQSATESVLPPVLFRIGFSIALNSKKPRFSGFAKRQCRGISLKKRAMWPRSGDCAREGKYQLRRLGVFRRALENDCQDLGVARMARARASHFAF